MKYKFTGQAKKIMQGNKALHEQFKTTLHSIPIIDFTPRRATKGSVGFDLFACIPEELVLLAGEQANIGTGVHIWIGSEIGDTETDYSRIAGLLLPRSSTKGIRLRNTIGLIDEDFQGEYIALVENTSEEPITLKPGQKFMQVIFVPAYIPDIYLVEDFEEITSRGENGFGHTGDM